MVARSLDVCIALQRRTQNMVSITAPSPQCGASPGWGNVIVLLPSKACLAVLKARSSLQEHTSLDSVPLVAWSRGPAAPFTSRVPSWAACKLKQKTTGGNGHKLPLLWSSGSGSRDDFMQGISTSAQWSVSVLPLFGEGDNNCVKVVFTWVKTIADKLCLKRQTRLHWVSKATSAHAHVRYSWL